MKPIAPPVVSASTFESEIARLLRLRFTWLVSLWLALVVVQYAMALAIQTWLPTTGVEPPVRWLESPILMSLAAARLATLGVALVLVRSVITSGAGVLRLAYWVLVLTGLCSIGAAVGEQIAMPEASMSMGAMAWPIVGIAISHFFACALLPWTPGQGVKPLLVLYPAWIIITALVERFSVLHVATGVFIAPSINGAGLLLCWWRISRLRHTVEITQLRRQFRRSRRDLIDARKIHELRFPRPVRGGPIQFNYSYEPMRQVGGDFLHAHLDERGCLHAALIDVTGHGIPAALTVNRVDGEVQRYYAEHPDASPGDVARALNRYFHLVMFRHGIFATAFIFCISPDGAMEWVNAGHPPAFIRRRDGSLEALESTTFMLGAAPDEAFEPEMQTARVNEDELVVIYTDGATEAVDERGRQFGVMGVRQVVERWQPEMHLDLSDLLPQAVCRYRDGATRDDVLITTVRLASAAAVETIAAGAAAASAPAKVARGAVVGATMPG